MITGYDQVIKASGSFGGAKVVFEGKPELLVGGFDFDLEDLPGAGVVLPCGTYVNCNEATRKITPLITLEVKGISQADAQNIELVSNGFNGPAVKVGDAVAIINSTLDAEYTSYATVAAVDGFNITLDAALTGLAAGNILVVVKVDSDAGKAAIKAVPNTILPYDKVYDAAATIVRGDGMWKNSRPLLVRRMPPITDAIKAALAAAGCQFKYSDRK